MGVTVEEMLDREQIRQVMASYNMGGDSARLEEFGQVFAEDAVLVTTGLHLEGRENIVAGIFSAVSGGNSEGPRPSFLRHHLGTSKVWFPEQGKARGRTYFQVISDAGLDHAGVYMDEFRKESDGWKIARRTVQVEYRAPQGYFAEAP